MPHTSLEEPSRHKLVRSELLQPHAHQCHPVLGQQRSELAGLHSPDPAQLSPKPPHEQNHSSLVLPQRLQGNRLGKVCVNKFNTQTYFMSLTMQHWPKMRYCRAAPRPTRWQRASLVLTFRTRFLPILLRSTSPGVPGAVAMVAPR